MGFTCGVAPSGRPNSVSRKVSTSGRAAPWKCPTSHSYPFRTSSSSSRRVSQPPWSTSLRDWLASPIPWSNFRRHSAGVSGTALDRNQTQDRDEESFL